MTQAAYEQFASEFVDLLLVPENEWLRCYFLKGGFTRPIQSISELAINIVQSIDAEVIMSAELLDALQSGDRKYLIGYVKTNLRKAQLSVAELSRIFRSLNSSKLRKTIIQTGNIFPADSGPAPKIPHYKYQEIADIGLQLAPVIEELLIGRDRRSRHSTEDILKHEMKDHPEACAFLLRHLHRLDEAFSDAKLYKRAKKIPQRARLLADALAGSDYGLSFRTSLDTVRDTRKRSLPSPE